MNKLLTVFVLLTSLLLSGCNESGGDALSDPHGSTVRPPDARLSAWVVYWDMASCLPEIEAMRGRLEGISHFAAYFNEDGDLFIPDILKEFNNDLKDAYASEGWGNYLTFVNDVQLAEGSSLKDTDILRAIFADGPAMQKHIDQIMTLTKEGGYDGIDIDYEAIRSDMELWGSFLVFCEKLYETALNESIRLRVILEPNAPTEQLSFPDGPEYVMMCYNLFGPGADKGPKADDAFLREMIDKMKPLPGKKSFALATGGYDWKDGEMGQQLTEKRALALIYAASAKTRRDDKSGAVTFDYRDEDGARHTVWYADAATLMRWQNIILDAGDYGIMLWRIGGNQIETY